MNLSLAAGDLVPINHLIQFVEPMSKPTNEPTVEPTNEHRYENYLQPLRFSDEPTSGSTNNNANNASELINIKLVGSCRDEKSERVGNSASTQPQRYVLSDRHATKIGVVTNELKNYLLEAAQRANSSTCKMLLRKVEPTNELSTDSWQCRMEIDESINLTNEVSIDSWQCRMEIDESLNAETQVGTW